MDISAEIMVIILSGVGFTVLLGGIIVAGLTWFYLRMVKHFDRVDHWFDRVDQWFDQLDYRFDELDARFDKYS